MRAVIFCAVLLTVSSAAVAEETIVGASGRGSVIIWKDDQALREGAQLIEAGVHKTNPALLRPLVSCIVEGGTKVIVTADGRPTSQIMIISGSEAGCRGALPNATIHKN